MLSQRHSSALSIYTKYPFLVSITDYTASMYGIRDLSLLVVRRPEIIDKSLQRIVAAIGKGRVVKYEREEDEVLSFYLALVLVRTISDKWLLNRYALAEAESSIEFLWGEKQQVIEAIGKRVGLKSLRHHSIDALKDAIGVKGSAILYNIYEFSVSFAEYVSAAKRLIGDATWRTVNLPVASGRVFLDKRRIVRLLKEAIENYVRALVSGLNEEIVAGISNIEHVKNALDEISQVLEKNRLKRLGRRYSGGELREGVIVREAFPPCMARILNRASMGEHLSHHERFAIATFMLSLGADIEDVVDIFRNMPDFNEKITRYQVEHLAGQRGSGKKYRTYSCETMKTLGLCVADCGTRTPIQAYYRNLRRYLHERKERKKSNNDD